LREINPAIGPIFQIKKIKVILPFGVRFQPEDNWKLSHIITKVNIFENSGNFSYFLINDLSWSINENKNKHFFHYQIEKKFDNSLLGLGVRTDSTVIGSKK